MTDMLNLESLKIKDSKIFDCTLEIENFKDRNTFKSKDFSLANDDKIIFRLIVYPKAWCEKTFIYLFIAQSDKQTVDEARFTLSILDKNEHKRHTIDGITSRYSTEAKTWSQITIKHDYLIDPANGFLSNGKLTVYGEVYYDEKSKLSAAPNSNYDYKNITNDLQSLLKDSTLSDVVLLVKEKEFKVHKCILASRSAYFSAMFTGDFKEKTQNRVEITDVDLDIFEELLFYIYTGKIPCMDKFAVDMFVLADKYQFESLKGLCGQAIGSSLTVETVAKVLLLADMHSERELKFKCIDFITNNSIAVMATESWKVLTKSRPDLMVELFQFLAQKAHPLIEKNNIT